jgi:Glycosyl transferase family 2
MTVLVLGMHRSGTSAIARLTALLGPAMCRAEHLVRGHGGNVRGHWESAPLVGENDRLLASVGARWWCPPSNRADLAGLAADESDRHHAQQVFASSFPTSPWVWKDPRTCLTLPFWLAGFDSKPVGILVLRDPREVAASVHARDGLSIPFALALWERHLRMAAQSAHGQPVLVTRFADAVSDPVRWCQETAEFLIANGVYASMPADPAGVTTYVSDQLLHHRAGRRRLDRDELSPEQAALWDALLRQVGPATYFHASDTLPPETPATEPLFDEARNAFGLVADSPAANSKAQSFVSSEGIALFDGPSPRRAVAEPLRGAASVIVLADAARLPTAGPRLRAVIPPGVELLFVTDDDNEAQLPLSHDIHVIRRRGRRSRAARLNLGAEVAAGDILFFLDSPDVQPAAGWMRRLRSALSAEVGAVGPALVPAIGPARGAGEDASQEAGAVCGLVPTDPLFNVEWLPVGQPATPFPVPSLSLRALVTPRRTFDLLGGFDVGLTGVGGEDVDYCLRLWRAGYRCLAVPAAKVAMPFETEPAEPADRLRNTLRLGLVHLRDAALAWHLQALAAHQCFADMLSAVTVDGAGRRRRIVDALSWYETASLPNCTGLDGFRPLLAVLDEVAQQLTDNGGSHGR